MGGAPRTAKRAPASLRKARDRLAGEDLARPREAAEAGGEVQRPAAITALDGYRLAGGEADPDPEWEGGLTLDPFPEADLQFDRGSERLPRRREYAKCLVTAKLDHLTACRGHRAPGELGKSRGEIAGSLVAIRMCEARVAADVCDQERADDGLGFRGLRLIDVVDARRCAISLHLRRTLRPRRRRF